MWWSGELRWGFLENEGILEDFWRWRRGSAWTGLAEFFVEGKGRTGAGNEGHVWHGNLEMRKKLEKESWGLTRVVIKGKGFLRVYDYANNVDKSQDLAKNDAVVILELLTQFD